MRHLMLLLLMLVQPAWAAISDFAREKKWADEIVHGVVVGDAQYLDAQPHKFLGSLHLSRQRQRDYAMAICMADRGPRASEVAGLRHDDIDWDQGTVRLISPKGNAALIDGTVGASFQVAGRRAAAGGGREVCVSVRET